VLRFRLTTRYLVLKILEMPKIEVCLTPALLHLYNIENSIVVVIDILRATSSITYGIDNGAKAIIPVMNVEDCNAYANRGYLLAAERNGSVVEGFDFGNSPFSYSKDKVDGKTIVLTTTNGTKAMRMAQEKAQQVIVGSFLNLSEVCSYLKSQQQDVLLLCAGWKDNFNLEDTLFAGAVAANLKDEFSMADDASVVAQDMYALAKGDLREYLRKSSHSHRLVKLNIEEDVKFCLQLDICTSIPVLKGEQLVKL
jgi:2-phosphosulfolactate phosphatase